MRNQRFWTTWLPIMLLVILFGSISFMAITQSYYPDFYKKIATVGGIFIISFIIVVLVLYFIYSPILSVMEQYSDIEKLEKSTKDYYEIKGSNLHTKLIEGLKTEGYRMSAETINFKGKPVSIILAQKHSFSLVKDRISRYMVIIDEQNQISIERTRQFYEDMIKKNKANKPSLFNKSIILTACFISKHISIDQIRNCYDSTIVNNPTFLPVLCDIENNKAYFLGGKYKILGELSFAQRMVKKYLL